VPNNGDGVVVFQSTATLVGGLDAGQGNTIAFNVGSGVRVSGDKAETNTILSNSIFSNVLLGIDLNGDGVTPNDAGDADVGPNTLQNAPVLTSATTNANGTTGVSGSIDVEDAANGVTLQFFATPAADPSGAGEGKTLLGTIKPQLPPSGPLTFAVEFTGVVPAGYVVSATATVESGPFDEVNTSEFSNAVTVQGVTPPTLTISDATVTEGNGGTTTATFLVTRNGDTTGASTVVAETVNGTATAGSDFVALPPTIMTFAPGETTKTVRIAIKGDTLTEALHERFFVKLSGATGATVSDGQGAGTIVDDEPRLLASGKSLVANKKTRAFTGVVATFTSTDFSKSTDFNALINWGDGTTSAGQIAFNNNSQLWEIVGTHKYTKKGQLQGRHGHHRRQRAGGDGRQHDDRLTRAHA
jgi:hypothetical protein